MKKRIAFCFVAAFVTVFGLAACGGGDEEQKEAQQEQPTQQEATQQQATQQQATQQQKTQQEPTQPAAQSDDVAAQLIGTWDATSIQYNPVPPGTQTLTFSEDGTLRSTFDDGFSSTDTTTQYSVLDDSRIEGIDQNGTPTVATYSLDGDTLTLDSQGVPATFQRTG